MARRSQQVRCERCGRLYRPCRHNRHHQKYCTHEACLAERARERKRASYRRRYQQDAVFREAEQERCRESLQARRGAAVAEAVLPPLPPPPVTPLLPDLELMATGLLAQLIGSDDPAEVLASARALERRGQLLSIGVSAARGSPDG